MENIHIEDSDSDSDNRTSESGAQTESCNTRSQEEVLGKTETRNVYVLKACAVSVLILSALGIALTVFFYTRNSELYQFENQFHDDANKVMEAIGSSIEDSLGAMDTFATSIVSSARATNQTWPFVTIPDFAIRASKVRSASDGVAIFFQPIVEPGFRRTWENYAWEKQAWVNVTKSLLEKDENYYGNVTYGEQSREIFNYTGVVPYDDR